MGGFPGWGSELVEFFDGLERDNTKARFDRERPVYQRAVRVPTEALVAALAPRYGPGRIFRARRDARFSAGRAPYHTTIAVEFGAGAGVHQYVSVAATELVASVGVFRPDTEWVARFRQAVAGPAGGTLLAVVRDLERQGFTIGGEALRTTPRGYPADHPHGRLLRHRGITATRSWPPSAWLGDPGALDLVVGAWDQASTLTGWLRSHGPIGVA
jgi:uncharacterized protein (TIGR02453 family)